MREVILTYLNSLSLNRTADLFARPKLNSFPCIEYRISLIRKIKQDCILLHHLVDFLMGGKLHGSRIHLESLLIFHATVQFITGIPQLFGFLSTFPDNIFVVIQQHSINILSLPRSIVLII